MHLMLCLKYIWCEAHNVCCSCSSSLDPKRQNVVELFHAAASQNAHLCSEKEPESQEVDTHSAECREAELEQER